jgi:hypothetical protein
MSTSSRCTSIRPASIRETSSSSVIRRVTRSASALTVSSDGRDQVRAAALEPGALLGAAQGDHDAADGARLAVPPLARPLAAGAAHVADADQQLGAVGQVQAALGVPRPGGQAAVGLGRGPPGAVVGVAERQRLADLAAHGVGRADPGQPRGRPVEHRDAAGVVGDDEAVGEVIGQHQPAAEVRRRRQGARRDPRVA